MRCVDRAASRDRYWCGPAAPDSSVTWLRHHDPVTGQTTVPQRMAVFPDVWDATVAWAQYLAERSRRGTPVTAEFAHFVPLAVIGDRSQPPPWPLAAGRATCGPVEPLARSPHQAARRMPRCSLSQDLPDDPQPAGGS